MQFVTHCRKYTTHLEKCPPFRTIFQHANPSMKRESEAQQSCFMAFSNLSMPSVFSFTRIWLMEEKSILLLYFII